MDAVTTLVYANYLQLFLVLVRSNRFGVLEERDLWVVQ